MREPHKLEPTRTMSIPRRIVYFDSESKVNIHIEDEEVQRIEEGEDVRKEHLPYLICATFRHVTNSGSIQRIKKRYRTPDMDAFMESGFCGDFWADVESYARMNENLYLFAHNAKYDVQVTGCVHYLIRQGYTVTSFSDENPFILEFEKEFEKSPETGEVYKRMKNGKLVAEPKYKTITILSSTNYYQQSLKKLGQDFNLAKLDFSHEVDLLTLMKSEEEIPLPANWEEENERDRVKLRDELIREGLSPRVADVFSIGLVYCNRDVEILERAMDAFITFITRENLGGFKQTVAGQAFAAFRHRFLHGHTIYIHSDEQALKTERDAYAGGRTECFRMGKIPGQVYYVDVNSMYPHVMRNRLYPCRLVSRWNEADVDRVKELLQEGYLVICDTHIQTSKRMFHKKMKRLVFPVGDFWTTLCTPELIKAFDEEAIVEVRNVCIYEADHFFEPYVDYFYAKRLEAKAAKDAVHDLLYKIFLNSLYGKFGQKNTRWEQVEPADPEEVEVYHTYDVDTKSRQIFKVFGGWVWKKNDDGHDEEAMNSFPAVAAHVTAYARMLLWEAIECAGVENVFYCDTDSLMCNLTGYERLQADGYLDNKILGKLKLEKMGELELYGCKDYIFTNEGKEDVKIKGVSKSAKPLPPTKDGHLRFAVTQWGGFTDRLKNKDFSVYSNRVIIKTLKRDYNKGIVKGSEIIPYQLNETQEIKQEYIQEFTEEINDLFISDWIKYWCNTHGYMKCIYPGEKYYSEYRELPAKYKMNYFRKTGTPIDIWAEDIGKTPSEILEEFHSRR